MTDTLHLPRQTRGGPDDLGLEVRAATFNESERTVELVWSTGARVRRYSWREGAIDEELAMGANNIRLGRLNAGAPFLNTHDGYDLRGVIGSVVPGTAKIQGGKGIATVKLSARDEVAGFVRDIRDGVIRNVSVGYKIFSVEKTEGQEGDPPVWRVTDWKPTESTIH